MAQCQICKRVGSMKRCRKCDSTWCAECARQGKGPYRKSPGGNKCEYCGKYDCVESLR
jgi:hypothetical protein